MPIVTKKLHVRWNKWNKDCLVEKGYEFTNFGDGLEINVQDLPPNSYQIVRCKCDFCGAFFDRQYVNVPKEGPINCRNRMCINERHNYTWKKNNGIK